MIHTATIMFTIRSRLRTFFSPSNLTKKCMVNTSFLRKTKPHPRLLLLGTRGVVFCFLFVLQRVYLLVRRYRRLEQKAFASTSRWRQARLLAPVLFVSTLTTTIVSSESVESGKAQTSPHRETKLSLRVAVNTTSTVSTTVAMLSSIYLHLLY